MTRATLAAAATIADVTNVTPLYRQSLRTGDGFVRISQRRKAANGFGYVQDWEVWIALPSDLGAAETWLDDHLDAVVEAINTVIVVATVTPSQLVLGAATANGIVVAGTIPVV